MKFSAGSLSQKSVAALLAGIIFGFLLLLLREHLISIGEEDIWRVVNNLLFQDITKAGSEKALGIFFIVGQLFIKSMQVVIVPMIFTSIVLAVGRIGDVKTLSRLSMKTVRWFFISTALSLATACMVGYFALSVGWFSVEPEKIAVARKVTAINPLSVLLGIIPDNAVSALASNSNILSVVFLAVGVGLAINYLGEERTKTVRAAIFQVNCIVSAILRFIIVNFAPIAIFALLTRSFAVYGVGYLRSSLVYLVLTISVLSLFFIVGYPLLIMIGSGLDPRPFMKKISTVAAFGFATCSSAATLPANMAVCERKLGIDNTVSSFVLPLGMTINMDGTSIMQVMATLFAAGCGGYAVDFQTLPVIALLVLIASIGTPGVPGAGAISLFAVLSGAGFVNDNAMLAYTLILAINRPVGMILTALNVVGDAMAALIVAVSEKKLNRAVYESDSETNFAAYLSPEGHM